MEGISGTARGEPKSAKVERLVILTQPISYDEAFEYVARAGEEVGFKITYKYKEGGYPFYNFKEGGFLNMHSSYYKKSTLFQNLLQHAAFVLNPIPLKPTFPGTSEIKIMAAIEVKKKHAIAQQVIFRAGAYGKFEKYETRQELLEHISNLYFHALSKYLKFSAK